MDAESDMGTEPLRLELSKYHESDGAPRFTQPQCMGDDSPSEAREQEIFDPESTDDLSDTQEWDEMEQNGTGTENFIASGPSSGQSQVQNPASSSLEWEIAGKNGNELEKYCPFTPRNPGPQGSAHQSDAEEEDSESTYPELVRGLLEFLGDGESEPGSEIEKVSPLTPRQLSALPYLAAFPSANQAARAAGIGKSTLYRWLEDDHFREELTRLREEAAEFARQELKGLQLRAVDVFRDAMNHRNVAVRLRAARYSMSFSSQIELAEKLRQDIEHLDIAFDEWKSRRPVV